MRKLNPKILGNFDLQCLQPFVHEFEDSSTGYALQVIVVGIGGHPFITGGPGVDPNLLGQPGSGDQVQGAKNRGLTNIGMAEFNPAIKFLGRYVIVLAEKLFQDAFPLTG